MNDLDLVTPEVAQLIQLFSAQPDLRFPDLDAPVLQVALVNVRERAEQLQRAEEAVAAARAALDEQEEQLLKKAHRAHAYLRVFAEADDALMQKVEAISLPKLRRAARSEPLAAADGLTPEPRKRGRPRKVQPSGDSLFDANEQTQLA